MQSVKKNSASEWRRSKLPPHKHVKMLLRCGKAYGIALGKIAQKHRFHHRTTALADDKFCEARGTGFGLDRCSSFHNSILCFLPWPGPASAQAPAVFTCSASADRTSIRIQRDIWISLWFPIIETSAFSGGYLKTSAAIVKRRGLDFC